MVSHYISFYTIIYARYKIKQGVVTIEPITIIAAVIALILGAVIGFCYRKQIAEAKIGVAEKRANDIVEDAKKEAEAKKKEILLEAKEESIRTKNELEKEARDRRNELSRTERRLRKARGADEQKIGRP